MSDESMSQRVSALNYSIKWKLKFQRVLRSTHWNEGLGLINKLLLFWLWVSVTHDSWLIASLTHLTHKTCVLVIFKQATLARFKTLRLTTSHTYLYKKLDEFGKEHKKSICDAVVHQGQYMCNNRCVDGAEQPQCPQVDSPDTGRKLVFDNLDYTQEVHWMTEGHQNIDCHYVTAMSTENRVSGNELSPVPPPHGVMEMENGKCVPSNLDNARDRKSVV